jgi:hypothetical protein
MTFLQYVARDILAKYPEGLADVAVVFPNKRASLFLNQALYEAAGQPLWSPAYITISDLFERHSTLVIPDQIELVFRLYNIFCELTGSDETLDHFFSWGQLMLADFDDLDKNMAEADKLFVTLEAWERMKDTTFLTDKQKKSLEEFFNKVIEDTQLQQNFNAIWANLGQIYEQFRASLRAEGLAYEGMLYRDVVEQQELDFHYRHYIFVGFNLLQKVEQRLFRRLAEQGKASFYWDYDQYYMDKKNEAGRYIARYLDIFPNQLSPSLISPALQHEHDIYRGLSTAKQVTYVSAPTEDIQARYVSQWLMENERYKAGNRTAIVLGDESLLQTVVHCLPEQVGLVNITTGFPLASSPVSTLVTTLIDLQLKGRVDRSGKYRLKYVSRVLQHPYARFVSDHAQPLLDDLTTHHRLYPSRRELTEGYDEGLQALFTDVALTEQGYLPLLSWVAGILKRVGIGSAETDDQLLHEAVFRMFTLINRLDDIMVVRPNDATPATGEALPLPAVDPESGKQVVSVNILQRLMTQLVQSATIPFHGEPAQGIQIMGVLETRNLDFDHVLMLSCNEGNIPKGVNDASFIPHSLRQGYELTTVENKVAIYAYYFYSLLQRAGDITLAYNNATSDDGKKEMSRFMLQYLLESPLQQPIQRLTLQSGQRVQSQQRQAVAKTAAVIAKLDGLQRLSPSAINRYLRCELQFFYNTVCGLREPENEDEDEIDSRSFGNIFHRSAELIYDHLSQQCTATVTASAIGAVLKDQALLGRFVDQAFRELLFKVDDPTFQPQYNGLHLLHRRVVLIFLQRLLKIDQSLAPLDILAQEKRFEDKLSFEANGQSHTLSIGGYVDRLDLVTRHGQPTVRVVDYKTGTPLDRCPSSLEEVFDSENVDKKHSAYYFQAMLYASIIRDRLSHDTAGKAAGKPVAPALLFVRQTSADDYDPVLAFGTKSKGEKIDDIKTVQADFTDHLKRLLTEIFTADIPFAPTPYTERCTNCPYRELCGL